MNKDTLTLYDRVLTAEPDLRPVVQLVDALRELVRPDDVLCCGCVWESIVKPLVSQLVGWSRGYAPESAPDEPRNSWEPVDLSKYLIDPFDETLDRRRVLAETEMEKWLRSSEAFDAFTDVLLERLELADPGNGHGVKRASS